MEPISFETFWTWLEQHANCILRVATPNAVLYDDEGLHWFVGRDREALVVQAVRGKRLAGEVLIDADAIAYVLPTGEEQGEHGFEAVVETETERLAAYVIVLTHSFEEEDPEGHSVSVH